MTIIMKVQEKILKIMAEHPTFIIAEAGSNHNGDVTQAVKLIRAAADAGADAVKFQTFTAGQLTTKSGPSASYQIKNTKIKSQWQLLRSIELDYKWYNKLVKLAKKLGIIFLSTPHGYIESVNFLKDKVPAWKTGSGDLTNLPLLKYLGESGKPIILSTGMATVAETREAVKTIEKTGNRKITILHCTTNYPCPPEEANVAAIMDLKKNFPRYRIGFSDHTLGMTAAIMAVAYGAAAVEKHLTLDRNLPGPDQKNSLEPDEFKQMVKQIRLAEVLRGSGKKRPFPSELIIAQMARKAVIAAVDITKGTKITAAMLTIKRPAKGGLAPKMLDNIVGKTAKRSIKADSQLKKGDF
ncbi:hypothetical protein A3B59_05370 [Candidatus Beckwithbacteria bacterium RIFCSPLOWO2_01_FULL_49_47]|nr:MAG: hypothetical protein A2877_01275 [Candidatus Beckwithbacteria bacterium RIFCSPHIGHO2_01_FULL_49_39]OGD51021.1 MAG: hypothetical protein A3D86_04945 [Candidatus Beckwithbacteria bacterium RIFCSPHIGHO2_02_FULL_49_13]OGD51766.1 MAG: hypothetical protein A3K56_05275 [Candidatus Beckwithbacteria bacterium RIFCSPHIGHO2_12_FULL_49_13]OGD58330.1 MAG: hypothetical protein A3J22_01080 [Candidatus Beckwithbacteria bacterium RIFCSPLOWO2_02_FULL_49_12]OGD59864.1 MAG: hypothetical protein A3B59_05370